MKDVPPLLIAMMKDGRAIIKSPPDRRDYIPVNILSLSVNLSRSLKKRRENLIIFQFGINWNLLLLSILLRYTVISLVNLKITLALLFIYILSNHNLSYYKFVLGVTISSIILHGDRFFFFFFSFL